MLRYIMINLPSAGALNIKDTRRCKATGSVKRVTLVRRVDCRVQCIYGGVEALQALTAIQQYGETTQVTTLEGVAVMMVWLAICESAVGLRNIK